MQFPTRLIGILSLIIYIALAGTFDASAQNKMAKVQKNKAEAQPKIELNLPAEKSNFFEAQAKFKQHWIGREPVKSSGWKPFKRFEWFWEQRLYPNQEFPNALDVYNSFREYKSATKGDELLEDIEWTFLGPEIMPTPRPNSEPSGLGRINCVAFHPTDNNKIWAGSSFGGIWSSTDKGKNWKVSPSTEVLSVGISDITIAPSDPTIMYACTGDADAAGFFGVYSNYSLGVMKSIDGGATWSFTALNPQRNWYNLCTRVIVHPTDANKVWVATNLGIYISNDGLNSIQGPIRHTGDMEACRDLEMNPSNPDQFIGTFWNRQTGQCWISKSYNGAVNWEKKMDFPDASRIELAVSKDDPDYCYAIVAKQRTEESYGAFHSFLMSNNFGDDWITMAHSGNSPNYLDYSPTGDGDRGQGQYDLAIATAPDDKFEVFIGGVNIWKTLDNGSHWTANANWLGANGKPHVHADIHELEYSPEGYLYAAHDGGISFTSNGGQSWTDISNGLGVGQFYHLSSASKNEDLVIAGLQDCGTHILEDGIWKSVLGGDGMECYIDYQDNKYMYGSLYHGDFKRSTDGGVTWGNMLNQSKTEEEGAWITPLVINPKNPEILYAAYKNIWRSTNRGIEWEKMSNFNTSGSNFRTLAVAPSNPDVMYASIGNILIQTKTGWEDFEILRQNQTDPWITDIVVHPSNPYHFWVTYSSYNPAMKVLEYDGDNIYNFSENLPNVPVNCIYYQMGSPDRIYIGTDIGIFTKNKFTENWEDFTGDMPRVVVSDIDIHYEGGKLRVATYGRGLWETNIITCNLQPPNVEIIQGSEEICKGDTTILYAHGEFDSFLWSNGETGRRAHITESGDYYVTVKDADDCEASTDPISIKVNVPRDMKVMINGDLSFCEGDSVVLTGTPIGFKEFEWNTGSTERSLVVKESGEYRLKGISIDDCPSYSDWITVNVLPAPTKPEITLQDGKLHSTTGQTYQWYLDGEKINGATGKTYTPQAEGIYQVEVSAANGCKAMSDEFSYPTAIEEGTIKQFTVVPNPNSGIFTINAQTDKPVVFDIEIIDNNGRKVTDFDIQHNGGMFSKEIDISNMPNGMYIVRISNGKNTVVHKIIKK